MLITLISNAQSISFTFQNARVTNDGIDDFYEADVYIQSDEDFKLGSGLLFFNYNIEAFGEAVFTNGNFEYLQPEGSILAQSFGFPAYTSFITNDNTVSRVAVSFQQGISSGSITEDNVTSTPTHLLSIKIKYVDSSEDPGVSFEQEDDRLVAQFFTACGPDTAGLKDCFNHPGINITSETFDSSGAILEEVLSTIDVVNELDQIVAYPNPMIDVINLSGNIMNIESIKIFNLNGVQVKEVHSNSLKNSIPVNDLSSGVYFLILSSKQQNTTIKVVKQ